METTGMATSTPEPKKFSDISPLNPAISTQGLSNESQTVTERKFRPLDAIIRRIEEAKSALLKRGTVRVPRRFETRADFETLPALVSGECRKAVSYCREWAADPDKRPGPLLSGRTGTFKTHLVWATARALSERTQRVVNEHAAKKIAMASGLVEEGSVRYASEFVVTDWPSNEYLVTDGAEIAHDVRGSIERKNLDEVVSRYRQGARGVLLVDDVEVMKLSDWLHEELYRIFDYRYQEAMPTLIGTNLSPEELRRHLGDRIARRILDMTEPFVLG